MSSSWELYDRLIEPIPEDVIIEDILSGSCQTLVKAQGCVGVAATNLLQTRDLTISAERLEEGISWKEAAAFIKSWNLTEASIGAAAINAYYNRQEILDNHMAACQGAVWLPKGDAFAALRKDIELKKVATIGHFCHVDAYIHQAKELYILEREPRDGDYPDSACEFILPDMDYVYITGFTLVNKTLPRLLELSGNAKVILVGPSVPMAPMLFDYGVNELAGKILPDTKEAERQVRLGTHKALIRIREAVRIGRE